MVRALRRFWFDTSGATAIEYGLIACLIAMVLVAAWAGTGSSLAARFNNIAQDVKK